MLKQCLFFLSFIGFLFAIFGCQEIGTNVTTLEPTGPKKPPTHIDPVKPPKNNVPTPKPSGPKTPPTHIDPVKPPKRDEPPVERVHEISEQELRQTYGFTIRANQAKGDELPPQPGQIVHGKMVEGGPKSDTNWSAFTLVLFRDQHGYKILTQKRAHSHAGTIETPGGHLLGGQSWRDGAKDELEQEAGIRVRKEFLIFLQGGQPRLSRAQRLYGNANFFVVFSGRPQTSNTSGEVDAAYGHQWLDLKSTYEEVLAENNNNRFAHGKYYSFFRGHLLTFCSQVLDCSKQ